MKKKVLIFGFGSIGIRHANLLYKLKKISNVVVFSRRRINKFKSTNNIKDILEYNPDYIVVCSETYQHHRSIKIIEKHFDKPLDWYCLSVWDVDFKYLEFLQKHIDSDHSMKKGQYYKKRGYNMRSFRKFHLLIPPKAK